MGRYLYYIIALVTAGLMFLTYFLVHKKAEKKIPLVTKLVGWGLFLLYFVWFLLGKGGLLSSIYKLQLPEPYIYEHFAIGGEGAAAVMMLTFWAFTISHITGIVSSFFDFKIIHRMEQYVSPVLLLFSLVALPYLTCGQSKTFDFTVTGLFIAIELGVLIAKTVHQLIYNRVSMKMNKGEIIEFVLCVLGAILFTMMDFIPVAFSGNSQILAPLKDFGSGHRYYIYATFIFLIGLSLLLRNHKGEYARMIMLFISFGGMISFSYGYDFSIFIRPYDWPLHICNTAMFILPIALATKNEKVFYFTFFINILGAFLAIMMPNYNEPIFLNSPRTIGFFTNHIEAMAAPLVCVLTGIFPRPKKKQFFYSMVGFAIYYVLVLFFNTFFTALWPKREFDYFYINSDFVASKVHAEGLLKNFGWTFTINGMKFQMYPLYQAIYFAGFILMSIGMWYVYAWIFKFQDYLIYLNQRSRKIKFDEIALSQQYGQKEVKNCMNPESVNKLVISHFGKRYTESAPFAVRDINFVANAGEIIGFLGPNGAGKSTTIKAVVGIHLPTEGKIEVNGYDVAVQPVEAKSQLGFVPDHYALYENLTGREYLNYIADLYKVSQEDRDAFLKEFLKTLAMEDAIDNKIQTYSHGMKQKIAIMASIIHKPKLWILDEPLTGLDPVSIFQVKQCLKRHAEQGNIVFFSSHLIDIVEKLCDRIIIIAHHKVVDVANVKELVDKGVDLEQYYMEKTGLETGN